MCDINLEKTSIVHWYPDLETHKCGYCKKENGAASYGMWAEQLSVDDYQNLIDRGWRRSGMYCYKAVMDQTCCPLYTIRCKAMEFTMSKSHKRIIKKFNRFLKDGHIPFCKASNADSSDNDVDISHGCPTFAVKEQPVLQICKNKLDEVQDEPFIQQDPSTSNEIKKRINSNSECQSTSSVVPSRKSASYKQGEGINPSKPPCRKAKLIRLEKRQKKLLESGMNIEVQVANEPKTLEQFLSEIPEDSKYKLKIDLVLALGLKKDLEELRLIEFELYKKYQMAIHNDPPEKCTIASFTRFLITSPLKTLRVRGKNSGVVTYGTFHQQYWLNDKLIAVAVLDILPRSVSSVYFFYDPDYKFLTLGTYGALREIHFVQSLHKIAPAIEFYNMGFYIHTCPKMRYKSQFNHSFLLCPETYKWFPLEKCILKLQVNKYSRLNEDIDGIDENHCSSRDVDNIKVCTCSNIMLFGNYKNKYGEQDIFHNIGKLIGKQCAKTLLFVSEQQ